MAGIGSKMKKRPFPDEDEQDEAVDAEVEGAENPDNEAPRGKPNTLRDITAAGEDDGSGGDEKAMPKGIGGGKPAPGDGEKSPGQGAYDRFVKNGMRLIYSEQMLPTIIKSLESAGSPAGGLVNTTLMVVKRLESSAAKAGSDIPDDVVEQGMVEIMAQLAELSGKSGGHKFADKEIDEAKDALVQLHGQMAGMGAPQQGAPPGQPAGPPGAPQPRGIGAAMQPGQMA